MALAGAFPLRHRKGPLGLQEEGCGGSVCEQLAGGSLVPHLVDRRGGCGLAAGSHLLATLPARPSSLPVFLCLLFVCRWWERGLGRPPLTQSRPSPEPHRPR